MPKDFVMFWRGILLQFQFPFSYGHNFKHRGIPHYLLVRWKTQINEEWYQFFFFIYCKQDDSFCVESSNSWIHRTVDIWGMWFLLCQCNCIYLAPCAFSLLFPSLSSIIIILQLVISTIGLLFIGKLLEPIWGSREFLKFIFVVNFLTSACVFVTAISLYYITTQETYL